MINNLMNQKQGLKLADDGDPWAPQNLRTPEQKKNTSWTPVGQATDKKKEESIVINHGLVKN